MVLVDTPVWSLLLRRPASPDSDPCKREIEALIERDSVVLIGPIRQEVLSGIRDPHHFETIREKLRSFGEGQIQAVDYETAASYYNICRAKGIQGSHVDFLLCAWAVRNRCAIFTTDQDFPLYSRHLPIKLHPLPACSSRFASKRNPFIS